MNAAKLPAAVLALGALALGCEPADRPAPVGPTAGNLMADAEVDDAPAWSAWSVPVNLGAVVNSTSNDQHPSISKDGLSLYFVSNRPGGYGGVDRLVPERPTLDVPSGPPPHCAVAANDRRRGVAAQRTSTCRHHQL